MPELVWFENPTWERHVIAGGLSRMINCAALDTDGDGIPEIVLASEFANQAKDSVGVVSVLKHNGDPRQPWTVTEIDRLTTSHRLRVAKIDGGKPVVINAALTGAKAGAPDYRDQTPLVFYRPGEWKRETISEENSGVVHGVWVMDWDGDGRDEILTASFTGIHLFKLGKDGKWSRTEIAKGDPAEWPKSGSSDIAVGMLGKERYLAAIEPWHGNKVAIYRQRDATMAAERNRRVAGGWAHDRDGGPERRRHGRGDRGVSRAGPERARLLPGWRAVDADSARRRRDGGGGLRGGGLERRSSGGRDLHRVGDREFEVVRESGEVREHCRTRVR